ncbi:MAG: c-type cytochrome, partial [Chitinophagaceae bacterium]|nr:c-type cytochrome [Chitinophagaceae bacterium]
MRKVVITSLFLFCIIIACKQTKQNRLLQKPGEIKADEYLIDITKDTTLVTKNGALLKIPKGALNSKSSTVTLEIKEAYTMAQMIKAGLTTQSNGELLSSGGMIYINAKAGEEVTINQPIKVALPTNALQEGMQLFKGKMNEDGQLNWTEPDTLPENKQLNRISQGKQLFTKSCSACHVIGRETVGPDLAHIANRPNSFADGGVFTFHSDWRVNRDSRSESYDERSHFFRQGAYLCNLRKSYSSSPTFFPDLGNDILKIYDYIQNETDKQNLPLPSNAWLDDCIDSCEAYVNETKALYSARQRVDRKRDNLIKDNGQLVEELEEDTTISPAPANSTPTPPVDFEEKVSPQNYESRYYQFSIETFGWFNIDILIKDINGVAESELFVRLTGEYRKKVQVYLIIPSVKVYEQGGPAERNPEEFAFLYKSGKIYLPQGVRAYILAVSESSSSVAFALKEFITSSKQDLVISLQASTKEAFNAALATLDAGNIKVSVRDARNAEDVRRSDTS